MPKRTRLTDRRMEAVDGNIPYPGNVNQPDRKFKDWEQYHTFEQTVNHELPDMRHDWKNDERDEIGFGIPEPWGQSPTVASVRVAANKSVKLAYLLLGEKVAEEVIEEQANDFMLLGPEALDRTLARFSDTSELYAAEDEADDDDESEADDDKKEAAEEKKDDESEADDDDEAKEASEKEAEEKKDDESEADDDEDSKEASEKKAEDDDEEEDDGDDDEGDKEASSNLDIELAPTASDEATEEDPRLAGLFEDGIPEELPEPGNGREASEKKGVKSLGGGQPKVASGDKAADISSIWASAPNVSDIFQ